MNNRKRLLRIAKKKIHPYDKRWRPHLYTYRVEEGKVYKISFSVKESPVNMATISGMLIKGYEEGLKYENK